MITPDMIIGIIGDRLLFWQSNNEYRIILKWHPYDRSMPFSVIVTSISENTVIAVRCYRNTSNASNGFNAAVKNYLNQKTS